MPANYTYQPIFDSITSHICAVLGCLCMCCIYGWCVRSLRYVWVLAPCLCMACMRTWTRMVLLLMLLCACAHTQTPSCFSVFQNNTCFERTCDQTNEQTNERITLSISWIQHIHRHIECFAYCSMCYCCCSTVREWNRYAMHTFASANVKHT